MRRQSDFGRWVRRMNFLLFPYTQYPLLYTLCLRCGSLLPIGEELLLAFVSQRMLEQLLEDFVRHGRDVCAHARGFDYVNRMAQAGGQHLGLPTVVVINLDDV